METFLSDLRREVPEATRPRHIEIDTSQDSLERQPPIESQAA
ncbi:hypothetical protein OF850_19570 [Roseococcus sp. MDT2-1-1]|uniref:Uncharacterized protein n=1 Tax=Sabulicella glaciei TaxID=2984948 RepID=A0ABT3P0A0_9PROT|nr:hypothetical protein [Roseococcus sp. MDT2-1-1]